MTGQPPGLTVPPAGQPAAHRSDVGIVYATALELSPFWLRCEDVRKTSGGSLRFREARLGDARVAAVECGMGAQRARRGTQALLDGHAPRWMISAGYSGALQPGLKLGDIVVARTASAPDQPDLNLDLQMAANPERGWHVGRVLTVPAIVRTVSEKQMLGARHEALAVDMESYTVADICRQARVPCLVVRVISDDLSKDLPREILSIVGDTGSMRLGATLGALWKRPSSISDLWQLRQTALHASEQLARFLTGLIEQLSPIS